MSLYVRLVILRLKAFFLAVQGVLLPFFALSIMENSLTI